MSTPQALYLKYRPRRFADLVGQGPVTKTLQRALASGRASHAYLFTGPRGTGKTTTARLLAKGLNCEKLGKDGEPDDKCATCLAINAGTLLDVLEIDAASNRGIDEIRDLRDKVGYAPSKARQKVYIIDEVHMLTKEAFNALLKTLEEPPAHATFILATTEAHKVPATIISRCQRFDFRPAGTAQVAAHLATVAKAEGLKLDPEAAEMLARQASGSYRDALSLLDLVASVEDGKVTADGVRETLGLASLTAVASLERALVAADRDQAVAVIREAIAAGTAAETFRASLIEYLRALLAAKVGAQSPPKFAELAADWSLPRLTKALRAYVVAADLVAASPVAELPLELATLEFLEESGEVADLPKADVTPAAPASPAPAPAASVKPVSKPAARDQAAKADTSPARKEPVGQKATQAAKSAGATKLWEELLKASKQNYSVNVCLQKTRPHGLTQTAFTVGVQSDFFLKKLSEGHVKRQLEDKLAELAGRKLELKFELAEEEFDVVAEALQVFEGAKLE